MEIWGTPIISTVEQIVSTLRVQLIAEGSHLLKDMKNTHDNIMVTCISHGDGTEKKPSLGITTVEVTRNNRTYPVGQCHCFSCGYTADLPVFISECFGYNDGGMFGYKWITQNFVNLSIEMRKPIELSMNREELTIDIEESILPEQLEYYRFIHPYMYERKLTDKVIEYFDVGYDKNKNSLTFPVHNLNGEVVLIQRRSVQGKQFINDEGGNKGNYVYGLYQVYKNLEWINELYITESPIDCLTLWTYRIPAVALMGAKATLTQLELLRELPLRKFISALDNDTAGTEGHLRLKEQLKTKMLFRLQFPEGVKDVNAMTEEQIENRKIVI